MDASKVIKTKTQIVRIGQQLSRGYGDWVRLADIADRMDYEPPIWEAAFRELARERNVSVMPDENQMGLTQEDRWAAVTIGGGPNHLIAWF
ncbi:hypothetical protein MXD61_11345 [Frankia sp. AgPm24]|uniref:hypothetical protein n=1 Tax=Frankia sp. AgPm24 TaxID=631128 RepID=UPI0020100BF1|nr:hypothetical protein [Frankia sp. AgPm24]MCK9922467.1 hypothetical protein [Frankia sp. AgPm24]